jgi:hypothetical protein
MEVLIPDVRWDGTRHRARFLDEVVAGNGHLPTGAVHPAEVEGVPRS